MIFLLWLQFLPKNNILLKGKKKLSKNPPLSQSATSKPLLLFRGCALFWLLGGKCVAPSVEQTVAE